MATPLILKYAPSSNAALSGNARRVSNYAQTGEVWFN
jgi:hypothetical protein